MDSKLKIKVICICLAIDKFSTYYNYERGSSILYKKYLDEICEIFDEDIIFTFNILKYSSTCNFREIAQNVELLVPILPHIDVRMKLDMMYKTIIEEQLFKKVKNEIDEQILELLGIKEDKIVNNIYEYKGLALDYIAYKY